MNLSSLGKYLAIEPTFLDIDILLSFNITIKFLFDLPALFSPSYASPPVRAPSPITAITCPGSPDNSFALEIPKAAEIEVLLWPALKAS